MKRREKAKNMGKKLEKFKLEHLGFLIGLD